MKRSLLPSILLVALATFPGCGSKKPAGTSHPDETANADASAGTGQGQDAAPGEEGSAGSGGDGAGAEGGEAKPAGEDPAKKVCAANTSDTPTSLFMETMLVRLPFGLSEDRLIEQTPFLLLARPFESVSCIDGLPGADVNVTAIGYFEDDKKKDIKGVALELLKAQGYTGTPKIADELINGRNIEFSAEFPADDKHPQPSKVWVAMKTKFGRSYYALFDVHPNAWNAMKKTLKSSTDQIFLLEAKG